jgi:hypothetical protein
LSTKISIIAEGVIDEILLPVLIEGIARKRADYDWPVIPQDLAPTIQIRRRGFGGVVSTVKRLVEFLDANPHPDIAFYVIMLDRRTRQAHDEVRHMISGRSRFIMGTAIEEIEAWWLADRANTLEFLGITDESCKHLNYGGPGYRPERDADPKRTLNELTGVSPRLESIYGNGNAEIARDFADNYWSGRARIDAIEAGCPIGFRPFCADATQMLRSCKAESLRAKDTD